MNYQRQVRKEPNQVYNEMHKDEVKYLFDILIDNTISNIESITGFKKHFISTTINEYL